MDTNDLVEIGAIVQSHGELYGDLEKQSKFRDWAEKVLLRVVKGKYMTPWDGMVFAHHRLIYCCSIDEPENVRALSELGLGQLSLANYWLDAADTEEQEEEEQEDESTTTSQEEKNAQDALLKCMFSLFLSFIGAT